MKHLYIISESSRASSYGVGTYIDQILKGSFPNIKIFVIYLSSDYNHTELVHNNLIKYYIKGIDETNQKIRNRYYRNSFFVIQPIIELNKQKDKCSQFIFHFNFLHHEYLLTTLKEQYPKSQYVFTVHYLSWCFILKGNKSHFKRCINGSFQHGSTEHIIKQDYLLTQQILNLFDQIIVLSDFTKSLLIEDYGVNCQCVKVVYNGLEIIPDLGVQEKELSRIRNKLGIGLNVKIILFVGRLDPMKGVDIVIHAFRKIFESYKEPCKLIIIGDGDCSGYLSECKNMYDDIIFTGKLDKSQLYLFYKIADIGVMPSFNEQCSYVAIEMLAHGIPLIVSTSTGLNEMLSRDLARYKLQVMENFCDVSISSDECAELLMKILLMSDTDIIDLKKKFRHVFLEKYTHKAMIRKMSTIYDVR